jgi:hypothetical protein
MTDDRRSECKSPASMSFKFRHMYKAVSPSAPPWKEAYRKRCQERLASSRQSLLDRFRWKDSLEPETGSARTTTIRDIVLSEWKSFTADNKKQQHTDTDSECEEIDCVGTENIDAVLTVFDEITAELLCEEEQILAEYEAKTRFDDAALCASISQMSTDELICPVCQKNPLFVNKGIVFCSCGLRIDTEQDAITVDMIRANLNAAVEVHCTNCSTRPIFSIVSHPGISNLLMTCQECDMMYIVV